jgi:hypothetical protein
MNLPWRPIIEKPTRIGRGCPDEGSPFDEDLIAPRDDI